MKSKLIFLCLVLSISLASATQIACDYSGDRGEEGGVKIWSNLDMNESNLVDTLLQKNLSETGLNCTLSPETNITEVECKRYFTPVINILNENIDEKNKIIKKQKICLGITLAVFVFLLIREIYLWRFYNGI